MSPSRKSIPPRLLRIRAVDKRVAEPAVDLERLLGVEAREQPLALALGDQRSLEHRVGAGAIAASLGGELERRLGVAGRGVPVAADLVAARAPGADVRGDER